MSPNLDLVDIRILEALQRDGRISNHELAARANLSPSPCWRRVRRLEETGVIAQYVALLDPQALGLSITAYAHVTLENHHPGSVEEFDAFVDERPEIMECSMVSGQFDYILRIVVPDMSAYEHFLSTYLLPLSRVRSVSTSFALRQKKQITMLNLQNLASPGMDAS